MIKPDIPIVACLKELHGAMVTKYVTAPADTSEDVLNDLLSDIKTILKTIKIIEKNI